MHIHHHPWLCSHHPHYHHRLTTRAIATTRHLNQHLILVVNIMMIIFLVVVSLTRMKIKMKDETSSKEVKVVIMTLMHNNNIMKIKIKIIIFINQMNIGIPPQTLMYHMIRGSIGLLLGYLICLLLNINSSKKVVVVRCKMI